MCEISATEVELELGTMDQVELQQVQWLWEPYIPFGKITIIQGDPGEGKTTLALRLAAACTTGEPLPGMKPFEPFNVIYQSAEDGLGDTIKPRLIDAGADQSRIWYVKEDKKALTLIDNRIEEAICEANARLMILDPVQGYLDSEVDMNRANEVRDVLRQIGAVAERTGCAIVLTGHLNKAKGISSKYRGLGSIDFRAVARSVLLVGSLRNDPNVRIMVHDKSSLSPNGKSLAFGLGDEEGFRWLDGYEDVSADGLLCGISPESKVATAEDLILELLAEGDEVPSEEIFRKAQERGIGARTVNAAKKKIPGIRTRRSGNHWCWSMEA